MPVAETRLSFQRILTFSDTKGQSDTHFFGVALAKLKCTFVLRAILSHFTWKLNGHCGSERGGGGRLPNKGRYRCAASAKPRQGKISQKKPNPRAKKCPKT